MAKLVKEKGKKGRLHIQTPLMGESLVSKEFLKRTEGQGIFPDAAGYKCYQDRGAEYN